MTDKKYADGIYIRKYNGPYGEFLTLDIKTKEGYDKYRFYPKKKQERENCIEFYGVIDEGKKGDK